jgi:hypothetical protein
MPRTINGLIIFIVVLLPGVPGERLYNSWTGLDWRENKLQRVIRIIAISVAGLIPYIIASNAAGLPLPLYVFPDTYATVTGETLVQMAWAYTGHTVCAVTVAAVGGYVQDWVAEQRDETTYPSAWDDLVRDLAQERWVVVALENGDIFLGGIQEADINAPREDRDLILSQPARYSDDEQDYIGTNYQYLYLPQAQIESIAVMYDRERDGDRWVPPGGRLFSNPD